MREPITIKAENTHMKKIITSLFIAAAMLGLTVSAMAQATYAPVTLLSASGITNTAVGAATWTSQVIDCRKASDVTLQIKAEASVTEANVVTIYVGHSVDGVNFEPTATRTLVITSSATGGTAKTVCTNMNVNGVGYVKIIGVSNAASAGGLTNVSILASMKLLYGK